MLGSHVCVYSYIYVVCVLFQSVMFPFFVPLKHFFICSFFILFFLYVFSNALTLLSCLSLLSSLDLPLFSHLHRLNESNNRYSYFHSVENITKLLLLVKILPF